MTRSHSCRLVHGRLQRDTVGTVSSRGVWPDPKRARGGALLGGVGPGGHPGDDRLPAGVALPPGQVARGTGVPDRHPADRPAARQAVAAGRQPTAPRLRQGERRQPAHRPSREAATARSETVERHQSFDTQRLWADPLSPMALCFNLFGDLAADLRLADAAVHRWWPDTPGTVKDVRFAHSPGRLDPAYLGNLGSFDVAFILELGDGTDGILGLVTVPRAGRAPPAQAGTAAQVHRDHRTIRCLRPGAIPAVNGTRLLEMWLDHLLVQSMLQHESGRWRWGRFVQIHPAGNLDFVDACARYGELLVDPSTFASASIEDLSARGPAEDDDHAVPPALPTRLTPTTLWSRARRCVDEGLLRTCEA